MMIKNKFVNNKFTDLKYINQMSNMLDRFSRVREDLYNCRCPFCNDSQKNKTKARGYFFNVKGTMLYKCHNCGYAGNIYSFLKQLNPVLHREYVFDKLRDSGVDVDKDKKDIDENEFKFVQSFPLSTFKGLKKVSQLQWDHYVKRYVVERKIPNFFHSQLFFAPKFKAWTNTLIPNKFTDLTYDEPRLIIPLLDKDEQVIGYQGRSLDPNSKSYKYITIILNEERPKAYGIDRIDEKEDKIYVVEGPIDSMFLHNSIAMAGISFSILTYICDDPSKFVFILDNEPRNKEIVAQYRNVIDNGYKIVILPEEYGNDINDMIIDGWTEPEIKQLIDKHTYEGLRASIAMSRWVKL